MDDPRPSLPALSIESPTEETFLPAEDVNLLELLDNVVEDSPMFLEGTNALDKVSL